MKRFERSNGLDTALYKNYLYLSLAAPRVAHQPAGVLERWLLSLLGAAVFVHFVIVMPALHSRPSERNQI